MVKLTERQFYSVGARKRVTCDASDIRLKKLANGRFALRCKCPMTGAQLTKFVAMDKVDALKKKYKMETGSGSPKSTRKSRKSASKSPRKSARKSPRKSARKSPRKCVRGTKKSGGCKKKTGPKRTKPCKNGVKKSGACKKKSGPKRGSSKK